MLMLALAVSVLLTTEVYGADGSGRITRAFSGSEWDLTRRLISSAPSRTVEWLNSTLPATMFAADDAAWTRTAKALGRVPLTELTAYNDLKPYISLSYHIIGGRLLDEAKLLAGGKERTLDGKLLKVANGTLRHDSSMPVPVIKRRLYDADQLVVWRIDHLAFHQDPPRKNNALWECFPAHALVETKGGVKRMDELRVGDFVQVGAVENGSAWSRVVTFSHRNGEAKAEFVRIEISTRTSANEALELTPGHYVHLAPKAVGKSARTVPAGDVLAGDWISTTEGAAEVKHISRVRRRGLYAPHTHHGNIVVHGVVVSCYTDAVLITVAHATLAPIRAVAKLGCLGVGGRLVLEMRGVALNARAAAMIVGWYMSAKINCKIF